MINSRDPADLTPDTRAKCAAFIVACRDLGIEALITSTYRDNECQASLYAQGRTVPGKRVTKAGPGKSFHNHKCAFDFVPIVAGKAVWNDAILWELCGKAAEKVGLEWGGRWDFVDKPHCQNAQGATIAQLMAGKVLA